MEYSNEKKERIHSKINELCSKSNGKFSLKNADILQIAKKQRWEDQSISYKIDFIQVFEITARTPFFIVVPWSRDIQLPFQIFGVFEGNLPQPIAFTKKKWLTNEDIWNNSLKASIDKLSFKGIFKWEWAANMTEFKRELEWGTQAMPLRDNKFLFLFQNVPNANIDFNLFLNIANKLQEILTQINFQGINSAALVFPSSAFVAIQKQIPEMLDLLPDENVWKNISLVTELDYEEAINKLVDIAKAKLESETENIEINKNTIDNVFSENQEILNQLIAHKMFWQGKSNIDKISKQVTDDFIDKLDMSLSGLDDSSAQKLGCSIMSLYLGAVAIPVALFFILPKTIELGVKVLICTILLGALIFISIKLKNIITLKYTNKNENK